MTEKRVKRLEDMMESLAREYRHMAQDDVSRVGTVEEIKNREKKTKHQEKYRLLTGHFYEFRRVRP